MSEINYQYYIHRFPAGELIVKMLNLRLKSISFEKELNISDYNQIETNDIERLSESAKAIDFLKNYFEKKRDLWTDSSLIKGSDFQRNILMVTMKIPFGETITYSSLADRAGYPKAARAVGTVMSKNNFPILIPCHRVIGSGGKLCGFGGGLDVKRWLLNHEGV